MFSKRTFIIAQRTTFNYNFDPFLGTTCKYMAMQACLGAPAFPFNRSLDSFNPQGVMSRGPIVPLTFSMQPFFLTFSSL
jgi:hypothetical protein